MTDDVPAPRPQRIEDEISHPVKLLLCVGRGGVECRLDRGTKKVSLVFEGSLRVKKQEKEKNMKSWVKRERSDTYSTRLKQNEAIQQSSVKRQTHQTTTAERKGSVFSIVPPRSGQ